MGMRRFSIPVQNHVMNASFNSNKSKHVLKCEVNSFSKVEVKSQQKLHPFTKMPFYKKSSLEILP